jgi:WD40 repeat protein
MLGKVNNADPMEGHVNQVWGVGFHPKQIDTVYTGGFDGDVKLWKLQEQGAHRRQGQPCACSSEEHPSW